MTAALRNRLEAYYDTVPRGASDIEEHGPLTLFVALDSWPYYARPRLDGTPRRSGPDQITADDVRAVLNRQRELGVPRALEWVHETTPTLFSAARAAGMRVEECPLLVLVGEPAARSRDLGTSDVDVHVIAADDAELGLVYAAIAVGFGHAGTGVGVASVAERDAEAAADPDAAARTAAGIAAGRSVLVGAVDAQAGPVGGGSHNPRGGVTEIVGVGVLPAFRRRGIAGAVAAALAREALASGVTTVFCGAQDEDVARIYAAVGFRRVGTACIAEAD
ncbi:GNAT family N-acetyltransferase [Lapillicoccus sp.]|uniref:GNAT family N-acetyltransferase n=1 Tax=Lapillicoccus sp. TaxID=1909287 RepID=UPI003983AE18